MQQRGLAILLHAARVNCHTWLMPCVQLHCRSCDEECSSLSGPAWVGCLSRQPPSSADHSAFLGTNSNSQQISCQVLGSKLPPTAPRAARSLTRTSAEPDSGAHNSRKTEQLERVEVGICIHLQFIARTISTSMHTSSAQTINRGENSCMMY